ncbi:unnamed protein product [Paramecium primaurelia]|uniref:Uncharacterized protein n=1 Tax=Paramecium primaurelia TaxID=5886 RepID=A0A8S1N6C4_PARPR|nr:unnamed protein product [Paramecium primaurelia]
MINNVEQLLWSQLNIFQLIRCLILCISLRRISVVFPLTLSVAELGVNAQTTLFVPFNLSPLHAFCITSTFSPGISSPQAELFIYSSISSNYIDLHDWVCVVQPIGQRRYMYNLLLRTIQVVQLGQCQRGYIQFHRFYWNCKLAVNGATVFGN